ncbi:MAG: hypothetical protein HOA17_01425, partial [Candidatus Melainabacteria bacterium]|nr:hypothetical protein [Candidatus Melainabacteria bacterium]
MKKLVKRLIIIIICLQLGGGTAWAKAPTAKKKQINLRLSSKQLQSSNKRLSKKAKRKKNKGKRGSKNKLKAPNLCEGDYEEGSLMVTFKKESDLNNGKKAKVVSAGSKTNQSKKHKKLLESLVNANNLVAVKQLTTND